MNKFFIPILIFLTIIFCLVFYNDNEKKKEHFSSFKLPIEDNVISIDDLKNEIYDFDIKTI